MLCYTCDKYDKCNLPWKCSDTMQGCSAYHKEQTNEEWFCNLPTEKKAEVITDGIKRILLAEEEVTVSINRDWWICWLEEVHKDDNS